MTHNPAPRIDNGPGPWRTPGVRISWWTLDQWLRVAYELWSRRVSAGTYRKQTAHLDALAANPRVITQANRETIGAVLRLVQHAGVRPPRGHRGGTSWERIVVVANNALANHLHTEELERALLEEQRRIMEGDL